MAEQGATREPVVHGGRLADHRVEGCGRGAQAAEIGRPPGSRVAQGGLWNNLACCALPVQFKVEWVHANHLICFRGGTVICSYFGTSAAFRVREFGNAG